MANPLTKAPEKHEPPPFWAQLPMVFTYPAHGDAIVKIVSFSIAAAIAESFLPLGWLWSALVWLAFLAFCFRTLERTALGHLVPAEFTTEDRVNRDYRPLKQVLLFFIFMFAAGLNPGRLLATMAGIGLPYLALCAFLFLLLESAQYLSGALEAFLPEWLSEILAAMATMYFMVSMYYLMGYALYQNHEALGIDVQVDAAKAQQNLRSRAGAAPDLLGPETTAFISEGKLEDAAGRIEEKLKRDYDNNKLHDQYHKVLLLDGKPKPIARHVNEYVAKLLREKKAGRAVEVYEAGRKKLPDLLLGDPSLVLPLATQAAELRRDATAFELVKGFDKRFPDHADIPGVYLLAAKMLLEKHHDYAMAQKICQHLQAKYPQHPLAAEAKRMAEIAAKMAAAPVAAK